MNSKIKIAIAEDHSLIRSGLIEIINAFPGCTIVAEGENGKELISNLSLINGDVDICVLDISMPEMNGYDTVVALRKLYPSVKFLVLSMFDNEYSIIRMIKNGANGYLLKACKKEELEIALNEIHETGYYYSAVATEKAFSVIKKNPVSGLTQKELNFLRLCCTEMSYAKIAETLHISIRTVDDYQKTLTKKLNIHSRCGLVLFAVHTGIVPLTK